MKSVDPASLFVSWQLPVKKNSNEAITGYVILYARDGSDDNDNNMILNVPNDTTELSLSGLYACAKYSVTLAAVNTNGTGQFSNPVMATSGEDSESN